MRLHASAPRPGLRTRRLSALLLALSLLLPALAGRAAESGLASDLEAAQRLVDAGRPLEALPLLEPWTKGKRASAEALLLASTARFMLGDLERGRQQLDTALTADPALRQGWLNLGALHVADGAYDAALAAFERAEKLDPRAADNALNLGAVYLLRGELDPARERFARYVERRTAEGDDAAAEAHYLVASNYAVAGYRRSAIEHLASAFALRERFRLRARTQATFDPLREDPAFQRLMQRDAYTPPAGARRAVRSFETRYDAERGELLGAVIDALGDAGMAFDPRVEVTPEWALIWGDVRIKVSNDAEGRGLVEIVSLGEDWTDERWVATSEEIFRRTAARSNLR